MLEDCCWGTCAGTVFVGAHAIIKVSAMLRRVIARLLAVCLCGMAGTHKGAFYGETGDDNDFDRSCVVIDQDGSEGRRWVAEVASRSSASPP